MRASSPSALSDRLAAGVFGLAVAAAAPVIMYMARRQWFFLDEWDFLAGRDIRSLDDLMRPHNEHWSLIPIVLYRVLFRVVGLNHYWPYQLLVVVAHLGAAVLLRAIMRRAGVLPWLATAAATLFAYFGSGRENLEFGFQVTFTGSLALGLLALLLADHEDEDFGRRDAQAMLCGLASLMFSGIGIAMVVALAVAVLVQRGWKASLAYVVPLGGIFLVWQAVYGSTPPATTTAPRPILELAWNTLTGTFTSLGQLRGVGALLAIILLAGTAVAVADTSLEALRARYSSVVGLLAAAAWFLLSTGYGRALLSTVPANRYLHLTAAMVLPAVAVAATAIARRWRMSWSVLVLMLVVGIPGNIRALEPKGVDVLGLGNPKWYLTLADAATTANLPGSYRPDPLAPAITMQWLRDSRALGKIPDPPPLPDVRRVIDLLLSFEQVGTRPEGCVASPRLMTLKAGDTVVIDGAASAQVVTPGPRSASAPFQATARGIILRVVVKQITVGIVVSGAKISVCRRA